MSLSKSFEAELSSAVKSAVNTTETANQEERTDEQKQDDAASESETRGGSENAIGDDSEGEETGDGGDSQDNEESSQEREASGDSNESGSGDEQEGDVVEADQVSGGKDDNGAAGRPVISDYALTQAAQVGIPVDKARLFDSDESLLGVVQSISDSLTVGEPGDDGSGQEGDILASLPELNPDEFEPEVIKQFDALKNVIRKQQESIDEFQANQQSASQVRAEASAREVTQWFDKQISSLGEEFAESLGAGSYDSLDRGSSHFANRDKIANQMAILLNGYSASGQKAPPREEVFDAAARLVLRDEFANASERKLAAKLAKRGKQHTQRAGGQSVKSKKSPIAETAALIDQKFFGK